MDFETWLKEYGPQAGYVDEVDFKACWQAAQKDLLEALESAIKYVPELASVPGIAAAIAKAKGEME